MLRPIGTLTFADADGVLPRLGAAPVGIWRDIAVDIADQAETMLGDRLIAVLLRGSTARQTAVTGSSDIDMLFIVQGDVVRDHDVCSPLQPRLRVEATELGKDTLFDDPRQAWMRFALAYSGCVVRGDDILASLLPPRLGPHVVAHLMRYQKWLDQADAYLTKATHDGEQRDICQWLMKRSVRSLFESIMFALNAYSRDIYPCAKAAAEAYPDDASTIWDTATLAVAPTADPQHMRRLISDLRPLLAKASDRLAKQA